MAEVDMLRLRAKAKLKLASEPDSIKSAWKQAFRKQESGDTSIKEHPRAANGLQAYGRHGIVPELHIDKIGLDPSNPEDIIKWKSDDALQNDTFDKIIDDIYTRSGGDIDRAAELYYGKAKDKNKKQKLADGREMPSVNEYTAQIKSKLGDNTAEEVLSADDEAFKTMIEGNSRYKNKDPNDPANRLFNNPGNQQEAVLQSRKQAIKDLPLREQMGSGMGAFAYKFPGMGTLSEMSGLAPKGSAANKKQIVEDYEETRTGGQLAGELLPDAIIGAMGGEALTAFTRANKISQLGFKGAKALQYTTQGTMQGGVSAAMHAAQAKGSGKEVSRDQVLLETGLSAFAGVLGGKLGDGFKALAPRVRQVSVGAPTKNAFGANPINYSAPEVEGVDRITLAKTLKAADERLKTLKVAKEEALLSNSVEPVPPPVAQAPVPPRPAPVQPSPMPQAPVAPVAPVRPNSTNTPGFFPLTPEQQLAKRTAMIEADKARRMAEAAARRNAEVSPAATEQQKAMAAINGPSKEANLSSLANKQAALKATEKPIPKTLKDTHPKIGYHGTTQPFEGPLKVGGRISHPDLFFGSHPEIGNAYSGNLLSGMTESSGRVYKTKLPEPDLVLDMNNLPSKYKKVVNGLEDIGDQQLKLQEYLIENEPNVKLFELKNAAEAGEGNSIIIAKDDKLAKPYYEKTIKEVPKYKVDKGYSKADKKLINEATEAEKALALQKKLKGQRGSIDMSWMSGKKAVPEGIKLAEKPPKGLVEYTSPQGEKSFMTPDAAKKATETDRWLPTKNMRMASGEVPKGIKLAEKPPKGLVEYKDPATGEKFFVNPDVAKKLHGQRGSLDLFPDKKPAKSKSFTTDEERANGPSYDSKPAPKPKRAARNVTDDDERSYGPNYAKNKKADDDRMWGQRGAIPNPFAKKAPPAPKAAVPTQELRKIHANKAIDQVQTEIDNVAKTPGKRNKEPEYYADYNSEVAKWKDAIQKHPTVKGSPTGQMTVQDAHGLMQALDKTINYTPKSPGDRVVSDAAKDAALAVRKAIRAQLKDQAPDVSKVMDKEAELIPYRNAVAKKVEEGRRSNLIPYVAKGGAAAIGAGVGALTNPQNRWEGATYGSLIGGGVGTTLSTMAGAKLLKTLGKATVTDMTKTSLGRKTLSQLARASSVKSKDKK